MALTRVVGPPYHVPFQSAKYKFTGREQRAKTDSARLVHRAAESDRRLTAVGWQCTPLRDANVDRLG